VTTAVPKVEGDNITFVSGCLTKEGTPGWMQVAPGSDISCILAEYVASLGMQHQMVKRRPRDTVRVRGIGTAEGEGEVVTHDIWMSWRVKGRVVDEWVTESLTPVEGEEVDIIVEGWCAVLSEMSVPMLLGGDIVRQYDAMYRPRARRVVLECARQGRVAIPSYSLGEMVGHISSHPHPVYEKCSVWRSLVVAASDSKGEIRQYMVNRASIPPNSMKVVKVRYTGVGQVSKDGPTHQAHIEQGQ
jgi:hypothetical protein